MPDQADINRARQDLDSAQSHLADLLPDYNAALDRLADLQPTTRIQVENSTHLFADLATLLVTLPDTIAADPPFGPGQLLMNELSAWQVQLQTLLQRFQDDANALWDVQAEILACQHQVQAALHVAGDPAAATARLTESRASTQKLFERIDIMANLVEELRFVSSQHAIRLEETYHYLLAELGGGLLVGMLDEIHVRGEHIENTCLEWISLITQVRSEFHQNQQQLQGLSDALVQVENAQARLQFLARDKTVRSAT